MLSISHTLTGAFIATKLQNPILYIPVIVASHFLEDWIPHWDVGTGLTTGKRKKNHAIILEFIELGISGILLFAFWQNGSMEMLMHTMGGALVAISPDLLEAPKNFLNIDIKILKPISRFHAWAHNSIGNMWLGLAPQFVLVIFIFLLK